jgi:hypothetical protein
LSANETKESRERKAKEKQDLKELTEIIRGYLADGISCERLKAGLRGIVSSNSTGTPNGISEISPNLTVSPHHFQTNGLTSEGRGFQKSQSTTFATEAIIPGSDDSLLSFQLASTGSSDVTMPYPSDETIYDYLSVDFFDHGQTLHDSQPDPPLLKGIHEQPQQYKPSISPVPIDFDLDNFYAEFLNIPFQE